MYYSEIGKIIEAGLERDKDKVASFAQLLAKKMAADGEERGSKRIGDILERKNRSKLLQIRLQPRHLLIKKVE